MKDINERISVRKYFLTDLVTFMVILSFSCTAFAKIRPIEKLEGVQKSCFKKSLILGASISSGYMGVLDGAWGAGNSQLGMFNNGSRPGPVYNFLTKHGLANEPRQDINFADLIMQGSATYQYFWAYNYWDTDHYSIDDLVELRDRLDTASIIFAIDGFYWDAIDANRYSNACSNAQEAIDRLTNQAKEKGQVLVLGNVPIEDASRVRQYLDSMWMPPEPSCVRNLNSFLSRKCLIENNCYIIDFFGLVNKINSNDPNQWISYQGKTFRQPVLRGEKRVKNYLSDVGRMFTDRLNPKRPYILRGDGVHLTTYGESYISNLIRDSLVENPPTCEDKDQRR